MIRYTPEQIAGMVAMYEAGASLEAIATKFITVGKTVRDRLMKAGVPLRSYTPTARISEEAILAARDQYEAGATLTECAKLIGCDDAHLSRVFRDRGLINRPRGARKGSRWIKGRKIPIEANIPALLREGYTKPEIARKFGVSRQRIHQLAEAA